MADQREDVGHQSGDLGQFILVIRKDAATALANADGDYTGLQVDADGYLRVNVAAGSATGTEFAEDAAHVSGDKGTLALVVRKDAAGSLVGTDGDYAPLQVDANGYLKTIVSGGIAITEFAEDTAHVSADKGQLIFAVRKDVAAALAGTDGDYIPFTTDDTGRLRIAALPANSGVDIGDVDVTSVVPGTGATSLGKAEDAAHISGDVGVMFLGVRQDTAASLAGTDGDYVPMIVDANGRLHVNLGTSLPAGTNNIGDVDVLTLPALPTGTNNIGDVDVLTLPADPLGTNADAAIVTDTTGSFSGKLRGLVKWAFERMPAALGQTTKTASLPVTLASDQNPAHDAVDSGNPEKIGGKAVTAIPAVVATGDRVDAYFDEYGRLHVIAGGISVPVNGTFTRPADTTAYAAGDAVTDSTSAPTVITFTNCARANGLGGTVISATLIDSANQATKGSFELWLFDTTATPDNDNAVFTPTDAELATLVDVLIFDTAIVGDATAGAGGNVIYRVKAVNAPFKCGAASRNLFALLIVRNAYTPVSAEVFTIRLNILPD